MALLLTFVQNPTQIPCRRSGRQLWLSPRSNRATCPAATRRTPQCSQPPTDPPTPRSAKDDWRSFRARLVRSEAEAERALPTNDAESSPTDADSVFPDSARDAADGSELWAHPVSFIEPGSLLLSSPDHFCGPHSCTFFANTAILVLDHNSNGSAGVVINRPISVHLKTPKAGDPPSQPDPQESAPTGAAQMPQPPSTFPSAAHLTTNQDLSILKDAPVYLGGPVGLESLCVLHAHPLVGSPVTGAVRTASFEAAVQQFREGTLDHARFFLGYAGWRPGQLEQEVNEGVWLTCACCDELVLRQWPTGTNLHRTVLSLMGGHYAEMTNSLPGEE